MRSGGSRDGSSERVLIIQGPARDQASCMCGLPGIGFGKGPGGCLLGDRGWTSPFPPSTVGV